MYFNTNENTAPYLISVITPVYNAGKFIADRLNRLLGMELNGVEIVIVDDGSGDNSLTLCHNAVDGKNDVLLISQPHSGLSEARNTGIHAASGEYIMFLDCDDILLEEGFSEVKRRLLRYAPDILMGKFILLLENGGILRPKYAFPRLDSAEESIGFIYGSVPDTIWNVWRYVCRREFLVRNNLLFARGLLCEDLEWTPRALRAANHIEFCDEPFYGYYYNMYGSITRIASAKRALDTNRIVVENARLYSGEPYAEMLYNRLAREMFYSVSRYLLCDADERAEFVLLVNQSMTYFNGCDFFPVRLFANLRAVIPFAVWSFAVNAAKSLYNPVKASLGPMRL
ncbi:MAG: glycosyltransferase [Clostridiales bacterium]|nr:glycosyltransferase [Clostridiales bacterium]